MRITILIASLALIYTSASPIDNVIPEETMINNQDTDDHDDEAHANAQQQIDEMIAVGKSDADCRKLAKATSDDVTKSVAAQQDALNKMGRGSQCNVEGSSLISDAEKRKSTAESSLSSKKTALAKAKDKKFNFGDFSFSLLTEGQCGTFYNSAVWKSAKASVSAASNAVLKAEGELAASTKNLKDAKETAAKMVESCKCNVAKLHAKTVTDLNSSVNAANMKAWKQAAYLICILDHKTTNQCTVPPMPTVAHVKLDAGVSGACAAIAAKKAPSGGSLYPNLRCGTGTPFSLAKVPYTGSMSPSKFSVCNKGGWKPLCDYTNAKTKDCIWPSGCKIHWHNWVMPKQFGGDLSRWYYTCAARTDGGNGAACTSTTGGGSWATSIAKPGAGGAGKNMSVMCIKMG